MKHHTVIISYKNGNVRKTKSKSSNNKGSLELFAAEFVGTLANSNLTLVSVKYRENEVVADPSDNSASDDDDDDDDDDDEDNGRHWAYDSNDEDNVKDMDDIDEYRINHADG
jgi:phosphopantothenoylcysteine synthetase/decarboxylase